MEYAKIGNVVKHINEVNRGDRGFCPVCNTEMIAKKGAIKEYFAHIINVKQDCIAKYKNQVKIKEEKETRQIIKDKYEDFYNNIYNDEVESSLGFTDEQLAVINAKETRIMVNSVSGSGKTSTIEEYIKRNQDKSILYLVFNRSMRDEAKERFENVDNVAVSTIHSFAYKKYGSYYKSQLQNNINIFDISKALGKFIKEPKEFEYVEYLLKHFETFQLSSSKDIEEYCNKNKLKKDVNKDLNTIFEKSKKCQMKVTHNQYYKMWHLSNPEFENYDVLAIDEAQDINEAMVDIVSKNTTLGKIILIGDSNQSLYKFAKCVNAFELLDKTSWAEYKLTNSFRIGNSLAKMVNDSYSEKIYKDFNIVGMNKKQYIKEEIDRDKPYFELCRYNATIVKGAIMNAVEGKKIYIEGGKAGVSFSFIEKLYEFKFHNKKHFTLKKYKDYNHMIYTATKINDYEILFANKLIDNYGESLLMYIRNAKENIVSKWTEADICYSTLHKSKGKTITIPLVINEDCTYIMKMIEATDNNFNDDDFITECNLLYVGCTRAKNDLQLPNQLIEIYENTENVWDKIFNILKNIK